MTTTTILAFWGAFLSTLLGFRVLLSEWPRLLLSKANDDIELSVMNEAKHSIILHKIGVLGGPLDFVPHSRTSLAAVRTAINKTEHHDLQIVLAPEEEISFTLKYKASFSLAVLFIHWSSARLTLIPKIPVFVVLPRRKIDILKRSSDSKPTPVV